MKRRCLVGLGVVGALVLGAALAAYLGVYWNNPYFRGKRLHDWADQAVWDEDASRREQAVQVLTEAWQARRGEDRTQLVLRFVQPRRGGREKAVLPKEVIPFLLGALKAEEWPAQNYAAMALHLSGGPEAAEALTRAARDEKEDPLVREGAKRVLRLREQ
jgi:Flp pilus assembly protein TadD